MLELWTVYEREGKEIGKVQSAKDYWVDWVSHSGNWISRGARVRTRMACKERCRSLDG